jgi:ankyrin repeat protein
MLESGEVFVNGNAHVALVRAAENGHVDVVDCLLRHAMFDPSADDNRAIRLAAEHGHLAVVERLLQDARVDPSAYDNYAVRGLLLKATSRSSSDCCKMSASIHRPTTTGLFNRLQATTTSRSSNDC